MKNEFSFKVSWGSKTGIITFCVVVFAVLLFFFFKNAGWLPAAFAIPLFTWPLILFILSIFASVSRAWATSVSLSATALFFWFPKFLTVSPEWLPQIDADTFTQRYWYLLVIFIVGLYLTMYLFGKETEPIVQIEKEVRWLEEEEDEEEKE